MSRREYIAVLVSELAMHAVPENCGFSEISVQYGDGGAAFLLKVVKDGHSYGLSNMVKYTDMENFRNPLEFIQRTAEEFKVKLDGYVNPLATVASIN